MKLDIFEGLQTRNAMEWSFRDTAIKKDSFDCRMKSTRGY